MRKAFMILLIFSGFGFWYESSVDVDVVKTKSIIVNGYLIKTVTNLWTPESVGNNNTLLTSSSIEWLFYNHPSILKLRADINAGTGTVTDPKLRSDLNTVMAENAKLKTDIAVLKAAVAAHSDAIDAHDSAIVRLQTDSTLMTIVNTGTITKPVWKITTAKQ